MPLNLKRKDLYDLVWSKPRSAIAKQFGISDVRLGKLCREMNVPAPPRGYWANLAAGRKQRKYAKPALTYTVAERIEEDHAAVWGSFPDIDPNELDEPIPPPPAIPSSVEATLECYKRLVDQVPVPKMNRGPHPITQKFIVEDERLAKLSRQYSWEKPKFASPQGQALLNGLNQLLWLLSDLGLKPSARGTRQISMWVGHGQYHRALEVTRHSDDGTRGHVRGPHGGYQLWFDTQEWERRSKKPTLVFDSFSRVILRSIALLIIGYWEEGFRDSVQRTYDWKVADRKRAIEENRQAQERERQRRAAEVRALAESRERLLQEAVSGVTRADEIRSLVQSFDAQFASRDVPIPAFPRWRGWAMSHADTLDPRKRSAGELEEWFSKFQL